MENSSQNQNHHHECLQYEQLTVTVLTASIKFSQLVLLFGAIHNNRTPARYHFKQYN